MTSSYSAYTPPISSSFTPTKYIDYNILKEENPDNICTISTYQPDDGVTSSTIVGIIDATSVFSVGAKAEYKDFMDNLKSFRELQQWQGIISSGVSSENNLKIPQVSFQSLRLSEQQYLGSTVNSLSVVLNIPIISQNDNPWDIAIGMLEYVIGDRSDGTINIPTDNKIFGNLQTFGNGALKEFLMYAPHHYRVQWADNNLTQNGGSDDIPRGCATVKIGRRFNFEKVLITDVGCGFNNLTYNDGKCTNLKINVSFKPWRTPTLSDIKSWFVGR